MQGWVIEGPIQRRAAERRRAARWPLIALLAQWGGPGSCDFDGGGVGINDFLDLLAAWGPCVPLPP